ncbi:fanconi-associated nuclease 1 [Kwoniella mangroviensis CBS 10435]|uniref:Fanconi-associated nuclease n=1 Tax=Kwoniella mangroviensis CBS 10435 TaxID=1331196 RepID=A0A1B9IFJ3_9TREE|nr:fanconi-associated nuclease 1 [Kwoniella mangroviensis CBS 10435]
MNSSPPPPSFTLPPLPSSGNFPITPSPTPSPDTEQDGYKLTAKGGPGPSPRKGKNEAHITEEEGRISMYVKLFDEMINTVLESESYLFTARELWVLKHILDLAYEPHYLLTRLLLRRPCKIHPYSSLVNAYSSELGEEGVQRAMKILSKPLSIPQDIVDSEPSMINNDEPIPAASSSKSPLAPTKSYPTPLSAKSKGKLPSIYSKKLKPWSSLSSGLTPEEEKADPELAEALKETLWASKVGRVEIDDDGAEIHSPPPSILARSRSVSNTSSTSSSSSGSGTKTPLMEEFSLTPQPPPPIICLGRSEKALGLDDIMTCISAEDLKKIAKSKKIPPSSLVTRETTINALRGMAKKQTVLSFTPVKGKSKLADKSKQATLPFSSSTTRVTSESLLVNQLLPLLGHSAIQLSAELHSLISRVNLIFSRTPPLTSGGSSLMLPSILVTSHKRRYPNYGSPSRSFIWSSRDELLIWERAVGWETKVSDALGENWQEQRKQFVPGFGINNKPMISRMEGAKIVKKIWEGVWSTWLELVRGQGADQVDYGKEKGGLVGDRFKTGHVLTRIVYKGATALGILHEYDTECMVLKALLAQRRWRRSKRGAWYDRLALVLMNHYNATPEEKEEKLREATQTCIDALLDEDTHMIYRPALSRRLTRLENKLNLPSDERHISYASLNKCETRELIAPRVMENMGAPRYRARSASESVRGEREASLGMGDEELRAGGGMGLQQTGKSVWLGREGEVTVEGWVLAWWEDKGYKGFHSESSILTTLFSLLMWPILFSPLPGAFETPYQTAPLDLGEDTFAPSRSAAIERRLEEMSSTAAALDMLSEVDERERPRGTWAVGVNWEYSADDLREILECIGGEAMSGVCRMLAEEYRHRSSGVPDLIVWNYEKKEARFVEVKGPGDSLSETQKVWIDVLLSSGIPVEVCRVKEKIASTQQIEKVEKKRKSNELAQKRAKKVKKEYERGADGEFMEIGDDGLSVMKDEEEEGWEKEDEMRFESGDEGGSEGRWEKK